MLTYLTQSNVRHFTVKSQYKVALVERLNRSIKVRMWWYFTHRTNHRWLEVLPQLIASYNASKHRVLEVAPRDVTDENEHALWLSQEERGPQPVVLYNPQPKFAVGQAVRVSASKTPFAKGYLPGWTEEIFTVEQRTASRPPQYKLRDYADEIIQGSFYPAELQHVDMPATFPIERVLRTRRTRKGRTEYRNGEAMALPLIPG